VAEFKREITEAAEAKCGKKQGLLQVGCSRLPEYTEIYAFKGNNMKHWS